MISQISRKVASTSSLPFVSFYPTAFYFVRPSPSSSSSFPACSPGGILSSVCALYIRIMPVPGFFRVAVGENERTDAAEEGIERKNRSTIGILPRSILFFFFFVMCLTNCLFLPFFPSCFPFFCAFSKIV